MLLLYILIVESWDYTRISPCSTYIFFCKCTLFDRLRMSICEFVVSPLKWRANHFACAKHIHYPINRRSQFKHEQTPLYNHANYYINILKYFFFFLNVRKNLPRAITHAEINTRQVTNLRLTSVRKKKDIKKGKKCKFPSITNTKCRKKKSLITSAMHNRYSS